MFFSYNAVTSDGMNIILPRLADTRGWNYESVLSLATLAGCISVPGQLVFGKVCSKMGARFTIVLSMLLSAFFLFLYGHAKVIPLYVIGLCGTVTCSSTFAYIGGSALIANWFPKKKGVASGFTGIGIPFASATSVALFTFFFNHFGMEQTISVISLLFVVFALICLTVVRNTPQEYGEYPDNIPFPDEDAVIKKSIASANVPIREVISKPQLWCTGVLFGSYTLVTMGVMSQFVIRHKEIGISEPVVLVMLSICAMIGLAAGVLNGKLEYRFGCFHAFLIVHIIYMIALVCNITNVRSLVFLSIILLGMALTGVQIFLTSFILTIFGQKEFRAVYAIAYPLSSFIGQLAFLLIAVVRSFSGQGMRSAYLFFLIFLFLNIILILVLKCDYSKNRA